MMSPEQVDRSYDVDRSWLPTWEYTFGLRELDDDEIALTRATYDAALAELDDLFGELMQSLEEGGWLENTVVVLTSDHGEHLGEQHMLDHQYSIYQPLLNVPLVVHYPARFAPGRDARPVMNYDIFPTLLELAGVEPPPDVESRAVSLLEPQDERVRFAEEPSSSELGVRMIKERHPDFDAEPWLRQQRALVQGERKLIWASDGSRQMFDLAIDPLESRDLAGEEPEAAEALYTDLYRYYSALDHCVPEEPTRMELTPEQYEMLKGLGYVD